MLNPGAFWLKFTMLYHPQPFNSDFRIATKIEKIHFQSFFSDSRSDGDCGQGSFRCVALQTFFLTANKDSNNREQRFLKCALRKSKDNFFFCKELLYSVRNFKRRYHNSYISIVFFETTDNKPQCVICCKHARHFKNVHLECRNKPNDFQKEEY